MLAHRIVALALVSVVGCGGGDDAADTTVGMTTVPTTTSDESGSGPTGGESTGDAPTGGESGGDPSSVCDTCDYTMQYCAQSITDGPSENFCRPLPKACLQDVTCACVEPIECESPQSCADTGGEVRIACVEG